MKISKSTRKSRRHRNAQANEGKEQKPFFSKANDVPVQKKEDSAFFQPKLTVGKRGDKYEKEADAVADSVVNKSGNAPQIQSKSISKIQRYMTNSKEDELGTNTERMEKDKAIQEKPEIHRAEEEETPVQEMPAEGGKEEEPVQMMAAEEEPVQKTEDEEAVQPKEEEETPVQTKSDSGGRSPVPQIARQLNSSKGKGSAMSDKTNAEMSNAFGYDFSGVKIHTDSQSEKMNKGLGAQAFTHGEDVYFNSGKYSPDSKEGKRLLAHELTHVVQQSKSDQMVQREPATITIGAVAAKCAIGAVIGAVIDIGIQLGMQWWRDENVSFRTLNYCLTILSAVLGCIAAPISAYILEPWIAAQIGPRLAGLGGPLLGRVLIFFAQKLGMAIPKWLVGKLLKLNCISEPQAAELGVSDPEVAIAAHFGSDSTA